MEDVLGMIAIGLALSGMWIMVRDIRRTRARSDRHDSSVSDYWYLGHDEAGGDGCDGGDDSGSGSWEWLDLLDFG